MPNRLYKFEKTDTNNILSYHDRLLQGGFKNLFFEITEYDQRYQLQRPQIVQIDERYLCLIGGVSIDDVEPSSG
jgi:hypothetical protein